MPKTSVEDIQSDNLYLDFVKNLGEEKERLSISYNDFGKLIDKTGEQIRKYLLAENQVPTICLLQILFHPSFNSFKLLPEKLQEKIKQDINKT